MDNIKIDKYFAALKLIEILLEQGLINHETYANIKKHSISIDEGVCKVDTIAEE